MAAQGLMYALLATLRVSNVRCCGACGEENAGDKRFASGGTSEGLTGESWASQKYHGKTPPPASDYQSEAFRIGCAVLDNRESLRLLRMRNRNFGLQLCLANVYTHLAFLQPTFGHRNSL